MKRHYYLGDHDIWCDDLKAHGKGITNNIYNVTCLACLGAVQQAGELARQRERALLRDIAVFEIKWTAWGLMWCAISNMYMFDIEMYGRTPITERYWMTPGYSKKVKV